MNEFVLAEMEIMKGFFPVLAHLPPQHLKK